MSSISIAIVGNGLSVSAKCEEFIKLEFGEIDIRRLKSLDEFQKHKNTHFQLALIEQEALYGRDIGSSPDETVAALSDLPADRVVLAYLDEGVAHSFFCQIQQTRNFDKFGFLPMNLQYDCWVSMLRLVFLGQACVPQIFLSKRGEPVARGSTIPKPGSKRVKALTPREKEILTLVARGKQNKLIANDLSLSEHTVKLHMHHIITKLGVRNRTEAAGVFLGTTQ